MDFFIFAIVKIKLISLAFLVIFIGLIGCTMFERNNKFNELQIVDAGSDSIIYFKKINKLLAIGDFDGDGKIDTIYEHVLSKAFNTEIDSIPDPFKNDWDTEEYWYYNWFNKQEPNIYISFNKEGCDTLHQGEAWGLYCLINIGDINSDGKDEIALVLNHCDFSKLNICKIFTLCNDKWALLKTFTINESSAFEFTSDEVPIFTNITGFLEKQKTKWFYISHDDRMNGKEEMNLLTLDKCN